ncbi:NAD-dependent epimerase/dehydratase family protein [Lentzea sp. JNUCC 0626]|uniref:NAD-dependent epimerase/dehydratase family protein n=1 Tax=Lentzea sp. JNUCC 0626 TaxID=3367513 RepID=UPI00374A6E3C
MRMFAAGATGVIGRRVTRALLEQGHEVVALTRSEDEATRLKAVGAEAVLGDVFDAEHLAELVRAAQPDVLVHQLTDLRGGDRAANSRVRTVGTRNLVDAGLAAGVRRIVAQSIAWAYEPGDAPAAETVPLDPVAEGERHDTVAGIAALESAVQELPEWVVLRYGLLYGPDTWYAPGGMMVAAALGGHLPATADVTSFVHVDDAASAGVAALDWPSGVVNVCDDEPASGHDWLPVFCARAGAPAPSTSDLPRTPWARGADNTFARALGWRPRWTTWRESLGSA